MSTETPPQSSSLNERISRVVTQLYDARVEIILSLLLAVAALTSAWCAYQASAWSSLQATYSTEGSRYSAQATRMLEQSFQQTSTDVVSFLQFLDAYSTNNTVLTDFLMQRFRPEFKTAVEAWTATQPLQNPDAPATPFQMDEYVSAAHDEYQRLVDLSAERYDLFQQANDNSTRYVALTVLFATVLFFGGVALKTEKRIVQRILGATAILLFLYTLITVITYPRA